MTATTTLSHVRQIAARVRETLAELNYAQRRMAEIRMGLPLVEPVGGPGTAPTVAELRRCTHTRTRGGTVTSTTVTTVRSIRVYGHD
jgi:hypothetical protein